MIMVSGCLLGVNCKYNGGNNRNEKMAEIINKYNILPVCPEQLGGMPTPRKPNEIQLGGGDRVLSGNSKVCDEEGLDNTEAFIKGAEETLNLAKKFKVKYAILKEKSPSCGSKYIYDGSFEGRLIPGKGITAQLLSDNGIRVYSEEEIDKFLQDYARDIKFEEESKEDEV